MRKFNKSLVSFLMFMTLASAVSATQCDTKTPIKHLVVIFQENRSFDNYFATYPKAQNKHGEIFFKAKKNTPTVNGLSQALQTLNQNLAQPFRLTPQQAQTDTNNPDHTYTTLQNACDRGLMDKFVQTCGLVCNPQTIVMGYFDGNSVTALWNYAQHFALSDNFHATHIGESTIGALNLISGQVGGAIPENSFVGSRPATVQGTVINDIDPKYDKCSTTPTTIELTGTNIGNLLNAKNITWGWFQGGFANCGATHIGPGGRVVVDYVPHHNPFQYYKSTSNPQHRPPSNIKLVGQTDRANHLYDINDFWAAAEIGIVPAVSFLKAPAYQNGHGGNSSPFLEQEFLVTTINQLQKLPQWKSMAIIIAYDDSGGWYDHEVPIIINQSQLAANDTFAAPGNIGLNPPLGGIQGRPSYGFRLPFLLISNWAKENYVDHSVNDQTSILRFIEDNWNLGRIGNNSFDAYAGSLWNMFDFKKINKRKLILDPETGQVVNRLRAASSSSSK